MGTKKPKYAQCFAIYCEYYQSCQHVRLHLVDEDVKYPDDIISSCIKHWCWHMKKNNGITSTCTRMVKKSDGWTVYGKDKSQTKMED